jgi:hypothetical protein
MGDSRTSIAGSSEQRSASRAIIVMLALAVLSSGLYFAQKSGANAEVYGNDFSVYYHAAREVIAGRDPYQHSLGEWTPYIYPPLLAELIVPLALLPLPAAAYLWFLINAASVVAATWMSASLAGDSRERDSAALKQPVAGSSSWRAALAACAVVVVLRFVLDTFNLGQVNAVVAALAVAHVYFYARDRKALSAIALVVAVSIKLTPALLLVYHIAKLRLKFAVACATLFVAVTALSFLPFGAQGLGAFRVFVSRTVENGQGYDFAYAGNQSLRGAVARLTAGSISDPEQLAPESSRRPSDSATLMISLVFLAAALMAARWASSELLAAAPFVCCLVLLSPLSWKAHFVVLILPIATLISENWQSPTRRRAFAIGAALVAAFALFNLTSPRVIGLAGAEWADAHSLVFAGALVVFIASVAITMTRKFGKQPDVCYSDQSRPAETT